MASDKRCMCCTWFAHDCARATRVYVLEIVLKKNLKLRLSVRLSSSSSSLCYMCPWQTTFVEQLDQRSCVQWKQRQNFPMSGVSDTCPCKIAFLTLSRLTILGSPSFVVCAALKMPQQEWLTGDFLWITSMTIQLLFLTRLKKKCVHLQKFVNGY